ncbi:UDP-glucuronosyltransferase 1-8 [Anoplophora glabripennis]|uniref:UDP-glucuronosyltransferase 1-8 n=1 Tax=Anoplophora glabripennis TaxID=217634 RepID=UPI0008741063|nr:UDP-glucuronosyltransferase 1-8 [Anoplophora glabripennis]
MYRILILLSASICCGFGLNILVIFPHSGKSHFMAFEPFFKTLAKRGHNMTVISYFPQKDPIKNYRDVSLQNPNIDTGAINLEQVPHSRSKHYNGSHFISSFAEMDCPRGLQSENLVKFVQENHKFDVILTEVFNTNCFMGLVKKYQAPFIGLSSCVILPWVPDWLGSPYHPAYIPVIFMDYSDHMSFIERLENTLMYFYTRLVFKYKMEIPGNELSKKYLGEDLLENGNIMYNISLFLSNSHFTLNLPRPLVPADIEVGGIHLGTPKPLPSNIEKWVNESKEGAIFFSLGSLVKGDTFPKDKVNAFLKAFKRLPQRVMWKWENETMEGKPDNVMIQKWLPQLDVLCHPNVKLFISHGGLLGTIEAVHCGVPIVFIPQFGDQHTNAKAIQSVGGGMVLRIEDITEDAVYKVLTKVLSPDFRQQAKELSERFRDRPLPPLETAIYWVEYVARHKGAPHMRTAAVNMPFYKYYLLDVAATLFLAFSLFIYVLYLAVNFILQKVFRLRSGKVKKA